MTIPEMLRRVKYLNMPLAVQESLKSTAFEAIKLNQNQLRLKGQKSDGSFLKDYQSESYAEYKNFLNSSPGFGRPDFYDTGDFQDGFYVQVKTNSLIFGSVDEKSDKLEARDGKEIFGLTKENKKVYAVQFVKPELFAYITRVTGLKFR